jgi:hypothetical protein
MADYIVLARPQKTHRPETKGRNKRNKRNKRKRVKRGKRERRERKEIRGEAKEEK